MDGRVCGIDELAGDEAAGDLRRQLLGLGDGALHALGALGEHQLCAVGLQNVSAFHAHGLGHGQDDAVALRRGDGRQADAGVAGGGLNDDGIGIQQALFLRVLDHRFRDTVLDAAGGIEVFQFDKHRGLQAKRFFQIDGLHQRRIADEPEGSLINLCHNNAFLSQLSAAKPFSRSAMMSSMCSVPMDSRMVF